jgi:uncharacterized protein YndB with AHSA1/START domain
MSTTFIPGERDATIRVERRFAHPPERVWRAVSEPAGLATWFPATVEIDLRIGGRVTFSFGDDGEVTDLDPPRLLAFTWSGELLRFELEPDGAGTRFRLTHTFPDRAAGASSAAGWQACIEALDRDLDGLPPLPFDPDAVRAEHERFVAEFGLATPVTERVADGWQVRIERQLTAPAEIVEPVLPPATDGMRFELGEGTGMGARLVATWTGPDASGRDTALVELPRHVGELVARIGR